MATEERSHDLPPDSEWSAQLPEASIGQRPVTDAAAGESAFIEAVESKDGFDSASVPAQYGTDGTNAQLLGSDTGPLSTSSASRSASGRHARALTEETTDHLDGSRVLTARGLEVVIDDRDASDADREEAERYLVTQVLRMLGIDSGELTASAQAVADQAMVLITVEDREPNAAETLAGLIKFDEPSRSPRIDRGLRAVLGGRISTWQLHRWLQNGFFQHHVALSAGNPHIWHLSTPSGAFQALIRADQLDRALLHALRTKVRKTIDRLVRASEKHWGAGELNQFEVIGSLLVEVREFDDLVVKLWGSAWQVGGDLDRAAKLAVLRKLGLIPAATNLEEPQKMENAEDGEGDEEL